MGTFDKLNNIQKIDDKNIPQIIAEQFREIDVIKQQIETARKKAQEAKTKSENLHNERDGYSYRPVFFFPLQGEGMDKNGNNYLY